MRHLILIFIAMFALACSGSLEKFDTDGESDGETDLAGDGTSEGPPDLVTDLPFDIFQDILTDHVPDMPVDFVPDMPVEPPVDITIDTAPDAAGSGCASGTNTQVFAGGDMVGCAGRVYWADRDSLCASGWRACSASEWVELRGGAAPTHNYWTSDALQYYGYDTDRCWVQLSGAYSCEPASSPMRVCVDHYDPLGNVCNWRYCGFNSESPNEYFGGCNGNTTAGALCCR